MNEDGSSSSGQYNFNLLFFKRFYYLHKIFFPGLKNVLVFVILLATSSIGLNLSYLLFVDQVLKWSRIETCLSW